LSINKNKMTYRYQPKRSIWKRIKQGACYGLMALIGGSGCGAGIRGGLTQYSGSDDIDPTVGVTMTARKKRTDVTYGLTIDYTRHNQEIDGINADVDIDNYEVVGELGVRLGGQKTNKLGELDLVVGYGGNLSIARLEDGRDATSSVEELRGGIRWTGGGSTNTTVRVGAEYIRFIQDKNDPKNAVRVSVSFER